MKEPKLTTKRHLGAECKKCGTHVKRNEDNFCVECCLGATRRWKIRNAARHEALSLIAGGVWNKG